MSKRLLSSRGGVILEYALITFLLISISFLGFKIWAAEEREQAIYQAAFATLYDQKTIRFKPFKDDSLNSQWKSNDTTSEDYQYVIGMLQTFGQTLLTNAQASMSYSASQPGLSCKLRFRYINICTMVGCAGEADSTSAPPFDVQVNSGSPPDPPLQTKLNAKLDQVEQNYTTTAINTDAKIMGPRVLVRLFNDQVTNSGVYFHSSPFITWACAARNNVIGFYPIDTVVGSIVVPKD